MADVRAAKLARIMIDAEMEALECEGQSWIDPAAWPGGLTTGLDVAAAKPAYVGLADAKAAFWQRADIRSMSCPTIAG